MPMPEREETKKSALLRNAFVRQTLERNVARPGELEEPRGSSGVPAAEYQEIIQIRHRRLKMYINRPIVLGRWTGNRHVVE